MNKNQSLFKKFFAANESGVVLSLVLLSAIIAVVNVNFFSPVNLIDVLRTACYSFVIAAPLTLVMISGDMDLSIGAVTNMGGVVCVALMLHGVPMGIAIVITLLVGALVGFLKAFFIVKSQLMAFVVTLGLQYIVNGAVLVYTEGMPLVINNDALKVIGQGKLFGFVYWSVILAAVLGVAFHIILKRSKFGRRVSAIGGNPETARLAGISVTRIRFIVHIMVSMFAALLGVIYCSRFNSAQPSVGTGSELTIIASVIIGGAGLGGGMGSMIGTFLGSLMLAVIKSGLVMMHVSSYWQSLVFGLILIVSLYTDKYRRSKMGGGL